MRAAAIVEESLLAQARAGDAAAFEALTEPYRRALHVHCYRMLGSLHDAEDLVQETLLRAWRGLERFEGRSSLRAWLYTIATNACLDVVARGPRRLMPNEHAPPDDPTVPAAPPLESVPWIEPYPDRLLDDDPEQRYVERESIELAFIVAMQQLPALQRAVIVLRDVLAFSAQETADIVGRSVASVNSALQRARATLGAREGGTERSLEADEARLVAAYVRAWENEDVDALVALLREDATMMMPPTPSWYAGREAIREFFTTFFAGELGGRLRLAETRANRQAAFAVYRDDEPFALKLLTVKHGRIAAITGFFEPSLLPLLDL